MKRISILVISSLISSLTYAADWIAVDYTDELIVYVDKSNITYNKNIVKAWIKYQYELPQKDASDKDFTDAKALYKHNCREKTSAVLQFITYDSGKVVNSYNYTSKNLFFEDVIPESLGNSVLNYVCNLKSK